MPMAAIYALGHCADRTLRSLLLTGRCGAWAEGSSSTSSAATPAEPRVPSVTTTWATSISAS